MSTADHQPSASDEQPSPKALLKQLVAAASSGTAFDSFLHNHLAEDVRGSVAPRYLLSKPETVRRLTEVFAMAAGGTVTMVTAVEEGHSACARVLLTKQKHNLKHTQTLNPQAEVVIEASIWLDTDDVGHITQIHFVADMLTPALAMGMQMIKAPIPETQTTAA